MVTFTKLGTVSGRNRYTSLREEYITEYHLGLTKHNVKHEYATKSRNKVDRYFYFRKKQEKIYLL